MTLRPLALLIAATSILPAVVYGQQSGSVGVLGREYPAWVIADSNLVSPDWAGGLIITKNTLIVMFKAGATEGERRAAVTAVHGVLVQQDPGHYQYLIRVARHPNACGVKQAMDLLRTLAQVAAVIPNAFVPMGRDKVVRVDDQGRADTTHHEVDHSRGASTVATSHVPCPPGYGLLR